MDKKKAFVYNTADMAKKNSPKKSHFHVSYNAPVTLTFAIICAAVLVLDKYLLGGRLIPAFFMAPGHGTAAQLAAQAAAKAAQAAQSAGVSAAAAGQAAVAVPAVHYFDWTSPLDYVRLFTHIFGHSGWDHLLANMSFILLLGPILEDRYGSAILTLMITVTAVFTGVINACFIPTALMGASGIAFMMILLASYGTISKDGIPLSFILILALYLGREIVAGGKSDGVAVFAHIAGGLCGSLFAFIAPARRHAATGSSRKPARRNASSATTVAAEPDEE